MLSKIHLIYYNGYRKIAEEIPVEMQEKYWIKIIFSILKFLTCLIIIHIIFSDFCHNICPVFTFYR